MNNYASAALFAILSLAIVGASLASSQINQMFTAQLNPFSLALGLGQIRETFANLVSDLDSRISATALISFLGYLFWPTVLSALTVSSRPAINYLAGFGLVSSATIPLAMYVGKQSLPFAISSHLVALFLLAVVYSLVYWGRSFAGRVRNA